MVEPQYSPESLLGKELKQIELMKQRQLREYRKFIIQELEQESFIDR